MRAIISRPWVLLLAILAVAFGVRIYQLANESAWWDEIVSLECLNAPSMADFVRCERASDSPMTPVYFALAYYWSRLTSTSVTSMRLFSIFLSLLTLPVLYLLTRKLFDSHAGLIASLAFSLSLVHIYYAQEIRVYALVTLLALCSVYALWRALEEEKALWWGLHLLANALLVFTHFFTLLLLAAEGLFLIWDKGLQPFVPRPHCIRRRQAIIAWFASSAVIVLLLVAWLSTARAADMRQAASWMVKPGLREIAMVALVFCGGRASNENPATHLPSGFSLDVVLAMVVTGAITWFAVRTWLRRRDDPQPLPALGLLMLWLTAPPLMLCAASYVWRPCFVYRYILYSSLPIYIIIGAVFSSVRTRRTRVILGCALLLLYGHQATTLLVSPFRPDWRSAGRYLESHAGANDLVLVFQDLNLTALSFNTALPQSQMQCVPVWSAVGEPARRAHDAGRVVWLAVWLWTSPANIEGCFAREGLSFDFRDFQGWPNVRLYRIPA